MALQVGSRLGHYDVTALIGEGGMGQVYQATDTKLNRQVALKILPEAFAADPDRLARFQREAQVLASLNHPNIAAIYGLEESGDTRALVLELVEGPTLADRIKQGPIPLDEALPIAKQIAEALEAAHEAGVIHRDLKPANIKVRDDGTVKVLDFGLAKALDTTPQGDPSLSPTLTAAATQMGVIMGTAAYMSPEQARGKTVDRRADIWAFGVVLYEMLTGVRPFRGEDVSLTLASVMKSDVDVKSLPPALPETLRTVIRRCLEKDPLQRIRDMGDVRLAMEGAFETTATATAEDMARGSLHVWQKPGPAAVTALLLVAVSSLTVWRATQPGPSAVIRFAHGLPEGDAFRGFERVVLDVSPDGSQFVYSTMNGLSLRSIHHLEARPLSGTEVEAREPTFSPDGEWLAYWSPIDRQLKKIPVVGGTPLPLTDLPTSPRGISWDVDDAILYQAPEGILRVSADGGTPELILPKLEEAEIGHPHYLPQADAILFDTQDGQIGVQTLGSAEPRMLFPGGRPRYVSTGHIAFVQDGVLFAIVFDLGALEPHGNPVRLVEGVTNYAPTWDWPPQFSVSDSGSLVYVADSAVTDRLLALVDRRGAVEPLPLAPGPYSHPRLSQTGTHITYQAPGTDGTIIWIYDLSGDSAPRPLTLEGDNRRPIWTPDGERVTFASVRDGAQGIYWKRIDQTEDADRLTTADEGTQHFPDSWSPDGHTLSFEMLRADRGLWTFSLDNQEIESFVDEPGVHEWGSAFSPDGSYLAYHSNETGLYDVYVQRYPTGTRQRISFERGRFPLWSHDRRRLFYRLLPHLHTLKAVNVSTEAAFTFTNPETFPLRGFVTDAYIRNFDIMSDDERFIMVVTPDLTEAPSPEFTVVVNWQEELKRFVPVD